MHSQQYLELKPIRIDVRDSIAFMVCTWFVIKTDYKKYRWIHDTTVECTSLYKMDKINNKKGSFCAPILQVKW